jgi:general secretion pathway protein J
LKRGGAPGFTLIEVAVAIATMALMTVLAWRGIDSQVRTHELVQARADQVRTFQVGLAQWQTDLNQIIELSHVESWDWDGRILRLTRQTMSGDTIEVVAWVWRQDLEDPGSGDWMRWQSGPVSSLHAWRQAWRDAQQWGRSPTRRLQRQQVFVHRLRGLQLFVNRQGSWSHPMSSAGNDARTPDDPPVSSGPLPDGMRLLIDLPDSSPLTGKIVVDWVNPKTTWDGR